MGLRSLGFAALFVALGVGSTLAVQVASKEAHVKEAQAASPRFESSGGAEELIQEHLPGTAICPPHIPVKKGRVFHCQTVFDERVVGIEMMTVTNLGIVGIVGVYGWPPSVECPVVGRCFGRP
jgi:hypothetical protein